LDYNLVNYTTCKNGFEWFILQVALYVIDFDWLTFLNYMTCKNGSEWLILQVALYIIDFDWFKFQIVSYVKEFGY
jgi:hypothetical protein